MHFFAVTPKLKTLRGLPTSCFRRLSQCISSITVHVEPAPEAQMDSSAVCLCWKALGSHRTQKINDITYDQFTSDPSTYMKKRRHRSDDSILLRHMDDVVGTGPEEHLMSDFEHMKSSLHSMDVVVLRNEGDTINFLWVLGSVHTPCRTHIFLTHIPCVAYRRRVHAWRKVFAVRMSYLSISPSPFSCFIRLPCCSPTVISRPPSRP